MAAQREGFRSQETGQCARTPSGSPHLRVGQLLGPGSFVGEEREFIFTSVTPCLWDGYVTAERKGVL